MWPIKQRKKEKRMDEKMKRREKRKEKNPSEFFARQMASECEKLLAKL